MCEIAKSVRLLEEPKNISHCLTQWMQNICKCTLALATSSKIHLTIIYTAKWGLDYVFTAKLRPFYLFSSKWGIFRGC